MHSNAAKPPPLDPSCVKAIEDVGGEITALDPIGAQVRGIDLRSEAALPQKIVEALEREMAFRDFLAFKNEKQLSVEDFLRASCLWGGRELHSTHGVHPETPGGNHHIFRLSSVNSASGVVHPMVHQHPVSRQKCVWLHLGMTGAVIEKLPGEDRFRLLDASELKQLCHEYNDLLNAGLENGYAIAYEYQENDYVFVDNLAVAHRAAPEAHMPVEKQGLRIMHRSTVKGLQDLAPGFGLPLHIDINGRKPVGEGVWQGGGVGFRWEDGIPMRN